MSSVRYDWKFTWILVFYQAFFLKKKLYLSIDIVVVHMNLVVPSLEIWLFCNICFLCLILQYRILQACENGQYIGIRNHQVNTDWRSWLTIGLESWAIFYLLFIISWVFCLWIQVFDPLCLDYLQCSYCNNMFTCKYM